MITKKQLIFGGLGLLAILLVLKSCQPHRHQEIQRQISPSHPVLVQPQVQPQDNIKIVYDGGGRPYRVAASAFDGRFIAGSGGIKYFTYRQERITEAPNYNFCSHKGDGSFAVVKVVPGSNRGLGTCLRHN
jgi:hypothetical protein